MNDPLLTVRGLSEREGVTQDTIRTFIKRGGLPHYRRQGIRIRLSEYLSWLSDGRAGEHSATPRAERTEAEVGIGIAREVAVDLRALGIVSIDVPGLRLELLPAIAEQHEIAPALEGDEEYLPPLDDPIAFGMSSGKVPGFAKLRDRDDD